ncbi:hypothetical protein SNS2_2878 [Streptomyces netropsis]|nr:hypothetical protein SNS2_2878 [Streptomyces netropsis]
MTRVRPPSVRYGGRAVPFTAVPFTAVKGTAVSPGAVPPATPTAFDFASPPSSYRPSHHLGRPFHARLRHHS